MHYGHTQWFNLTAAYAECGKEPCQSYKGSQGKFGDMLVFYCLLRKVYAKVVTIVFHCACVFESMQLLLIPIMNTLVCHKYLFNEFERMHFCILPLNQCLYKREEMRRGGGESTSRITIL